MKILYISQQIRNIMKQQAKKILKKPQVREKFTHLKVQICI